ncbi:GNAT family N-acetyltransferase [Cohnella laeviribosi]|uniref:GNAT family N-acetyltransferase n=1 Tax=Cohnella laeviribosi TaxID=380174 RepID=UPI000372808C|nr:GNAT family N-acetyltransferase [Cohnella laeviribosi]
MKCVKVTNEAQLNDCLRIRKTVFVEEQGVPEDLELDEYDTVDGSCRHWLVLSEGKAVAAGRWREYEPGTAKFQRIAVLLPFRGLGVGRKLIEAMEEDAKASGYGKAVLDSQCAAERFYRKLGYVTVSAEPFYDANILHVRMEKSLR